MEMEIEWPKRKVTCGRYTIVKGRKGWSSWVRAETCTAGEQYWEITPNLSTANFYAVLEAGGANCSG